VNCDTPSAGGGAEQDAYEGRLAEAFELATDRSDRAGRHRRFGCALALFDRLAVEEPARPEPRLGEAICELGLGRPYRARQALAAARSRGLGAANDRSPAPEAGEALLADVVEAEILLELAQLDAARMVLDRLVGQDGEARAADVHTLNGRLELAQGEVAAAVRHMGGALAHDADHPPAHHLRGEIWAASGDLRTALNAYDRAVALDPEAPAFRLSRARVRLDLGDVDGASADLAVLERMFAEGFADPVCIAAARTLGAAAEAAARGRRNDGDR